MTRWLPIWGMLGMCGPLISVAQETYEGQAKFATSSDIEAFLDERTEGDEEIDLTELVGRLEQEPLRLNEASIKELERLPGVTPFLARQIYMLRSSLGRLQSVKDLLAARGMSQEVFRLIRPLVIVDRNDLRFSGPTASRRKLSVRARLRISHELQKRRGFQDGTFQGSRPKVYQRFQITTPLRLNAGLLLEKDQGEDNLGDFLSAYVQLQNLIGRSNLILGDYKVEAGQGVFLWGGTAISRRSSLAGFSKRSPRGVVPYRSVDESRFFRGLAGAFSVGNFELIGFFSSKRIDAVVTEGGITGFPTAGYHRTSGELSRRRAVRERVVGGRIVYGFSDQTHLGSTVYAAGFDEPVLNRNLCRGQCKSSRVVGLDFESSGETVSLFGEWARSRGGAIGGLTGLLLGIERKIEFSLLFQKMARTTLSGYGLVAHGSTTGVKSKWALYFGLRVRPKDDITITGHFDLLKSRRTGSRSPFPSWGHEFQIESDIRLRRYIRTTFRYRVRTQLQPYPSVDDHGRESLMLADRSQQNFRATFEYKIGTYVSIRGRAEAVRVRAGNPSSQGVGLLFSHQVRFMPDKRTSIVGSVIFFDTDSFDSRLYAYENDVRGVFANQAAFGRGTRWFLLVLFNISEALQISAKYAETYRDDVKTIGSGADQIPGNTKSRLNVQLDMVL